MLDRRMRALRQFGVLVLLLASSLTSAMACMLPGAQMSPEERACCRMMKSQCGQMVMPTSQDCCKKAAKSVQDTALKTETVSLNPAAFVAIWVASFEVLSPQDASYGLLQRPEHSPPKSPPSTITILRI